MKQPRTASKHGRTGSSRRGGRSPTMAVDTRYAQARRREAVLAATQDWHDWLIPSGVVGVLAGITLYHHALLLGMLQAWL